MRSAFIALLAISLFSVPDVFAQTRIITDSNGNQIAVQMPQGSPGQPVPGQAVSGQPVPGKPPGGKPGGKPAASGKDEKTKGKGSKKPSASMIVTRGTEPPEKAKSSEAILRRTPTGRVSFSFVGAKWLPVLEVIAEESAMSLDWQELPGDYLNLVTRRDYSIEEARDIVNRHLLTRGYTMLTEGETLHVVKLDKLNKANIPRVSPEELDNRLDHEFVKVSFKLNWLVAQDAVAELSSYKSKNGTLVHMSATNRIEAVDTVKNLKDIREMLKVEQGDEGQERLVKVFELKHRRASEVISLVRELMGVDEKPKAGGRSSGSGGSMQMMQQMQRQMQQQMQQMAQSKGGKGKAPIKIALVLNQRENSILAKAPPDKMAEIEQAIAKLDVENDSANSLLENVNKYKIYRLETMDPQPLVDMLNELGDLAPQTQLRVDQDQNTIIAFATLADHVTINTLVEKLDGASRHFEVLQLRRLEADFVAGTIRFLMGKEEEDDSNSRNNSYFGYGWGGYGSSSRKDDKSNDFRVDADVTNNRLLLFATDQELEQIEDLLIKLGEIPAKDSRESRRRLIDIDPATDPEKFLERLQQLWPKENKLNIAPVPENLKKKDEPPAGLELTPSNAKPDPAADPKDKPKAAEEADVALSEADQFFLALSKPVSGPIAMQPSTRFVIADVDPPANPPAADEQAKPKSQPATVADGVQGLTPEQQRIKQLFERQRKGGPESGQANPNELPPVNISFTPSGRLIITCDDPAVLNDMEEILRPFTQARKKHVIYTLKYASPGWIAATLREYFEDEEDSESTLDWWGDLIKQKKNNNGRLSSRSVPRFIPDSYSSTILVKNADARQLKTIEDLIKLYDTQEPKESRSIRVTEMFPIRYSKASVIANAIKDVYRDLLSANDKALEKNDKGSVEKEVTYIRNSGGDDDDDSETPLSFKGLLSIGVDEVSNTLIVSSSSGLMENIRKMVTQLDKAAAPSSQLRVIQTNPKMNSTYLQKRLGKILGAPKVKSSGKQQTPQNGQPPNGQPANGGGKSQ